MAAKHAPLAVRLAAELAQHPLDSEQLAGLLVPHAVHLRGSTLFGARRTSLDQLVGPESSETKAISRRLAAVSTLCSARTSLLGDCPISTSNSKWSAKLKSCGDTMDGVRFRLVAAST